MEAPYQTETESNQSQQVLTVSKLNQWIKQTLEGEIPSIWVKGEVSNFKAHSSGHYYFSLKDAGSQITAVMFRGANSRLKFKPHDGLEVITHGKITVYEPRGNYQLLCDMMEPVGAGALQKAYEQLKEKLKNEGLFDSSRKRAIPLFPRHIAVVTSPTGAAIRDILNILSRRAPSLRVTIIPTVVQGEIAATKIVEALRLAYQLRDLDAIILGRGGGSIEDLWAFNDEFLARTIIQSPVPIISAVGHEIDFTISDFVADLRAPTPSAAAELVAKSNEELLQKVSTLRRMLALSCTKRWHVSVEKLRGLRSRLIDPQRRLQDLRIRSDDLFNRLDLAWRNFRRDKRQYVDMLNHRLISPEKNILKLKQQVGHLTIRIQQSMVGRLTRLELVLKEKMGKLDSLSPFRVLDRGYSIVTTKLNQVVRKCSQVQPNDQVSIQLSEGVLTANIQEIREVKNGL